MNAHHKVSEALGSFELASGSPIPFTLQSFPVGQAPDPPFCIYRTSDYGERFADNSVYALVPSFEVELIEREADEDLEERLYEHLTEAFGPVSRDEATLESEHARVVYYDFTVPR